MNGIHYYLIFAIMAFGRASLDVAAPQTVRKYRLPGNIRPESYKLEILTNIDDLFPHFWGDVYIIIRCVDETNKIIVNIRDLQIDEDEVSVRSLTDGDTAPTENPDFSIQVEEDKQKDQYIIMLDRPLSVGEKYEVHIPFSRYFSRTDKGYYIFGYGDAKRLVATDINGFEARDVFPCFDDIGYKAPFKIFLGHPENILAITSAKFLRSQPISDRKGWVMEEFDETVTMSTYSVGFVIADVERHVALMESLSEVLIRTWSDTGISKLLDFMTRTALEIFRFYTTYFNVDYAMKDVDIVILPSLLPDDVRKNYGIIMFGSYIEEIERNSPPSIDYFYNVSRLCNALGHQWMGNYVTMSQWNEHWLHEGFNRFLQDVCVKKVFPGMQYNFGNLAGIQSFIEVLNDDAKPTSTPVLVTSSEPDVIVASLSEKTFKKAHQLARMMEFILGENQFERILTTYTRLYGKRNSSLPQVWETFDKEIAKTKILPDGVTMEKIMNSWSTQSGYPLVMVKRDFVTKMIIVEQERFIWSGEEDEIDDRNACWTFPLSYMTAKDKFVKNSKITYWMTCDGPLELPIDPGESHWILFNFGLNGQKTGGNLCTMMGEFVGTIIEYSLNISSIFPSRTNYDDANWALLKKALWDESGSAQIDEMARVRLISDMFALSEAGILHYKTTLEIISYIPSEKSYLPWRVALTELDRIRNFFLGSPMLKNFEMYVRERIKLIWEKKEFQKIDDLSRNDHTEFLMKILITQASCTYGVEECRTQSLEIYHRNPKVDEGMSRNFLSIQDIVYCEAVKDDEENRWMSLKNQYSKGNPSNRNHIILKALGCSTNVETLKQYLNWSLNDEEILKVDSLKVFESLSTNQLGYELMKTFLLERFMDIKKFYGRDKKTLTAYFKTLLDFTMKQNDLKEIETFLISLKRKVDASDELLQESFRRAKRNVLWLEKNEETFSKMLVNFE